MASQLRITRSPCTPSCSGRGRATATARPCLLARSVRDNHVAEQAPGFSSPLQFALSAAIAAVLTVSSPAMAAEAPELFANKCAGCHMNGGNVLAVGATLFPEDLAKNGVDSPEALYKVIYSGKGKMPGYGKDCAPKGACTFAARLTDEEVTSLATYVAERAAAAWK